MAARQSAGNSPIDPVLARHLADRVHAHRTQAGISQERLADLAGVSRLQIVRIETARANPTLATLSALAAALHSTVRDLLDPTDNGSGSTSPAPGD